LPGQTRLIGINDPAFRRPHLDPNDAAAEDPLADDGIKSLEGSRIASENLLRDKRSHDGLAGEFGQIPSVVDRFGRRRAPGDQQSAGRQDEDGDQPSSHELDRVDRRLSSAQPHFAQLSAPITPTV
jgi:hypothetical protein